MKRPKKPLSLNFEIDGYQEDQIVGVSIAEAYKQLKSSKDPHEWPENRDALLKAFKCVYLYYTGKSLK
jgi:hypothetical protein